jgi:chaperonin GroEL
MAKEVLNGHEVRLRIKAGIDKAAKAVSSTLGAVGMTAVIEYKGLDPITCDDGVTILKNLDFSDPYENIGLQLLRKGAIRTSQEGGDGTATTTVFTQALVNEVFKEIGHDSSKIRDVKERLQKGLEQATRELLSVKRDINEDDIEQIATISSLDPEVAKLIADVIKEVGVNGVITVEKGSKIGYSKEVVKGARFDKGIISSYFINQPEKEQTVLENPYILIADRKISTNEQIASVMNELERVGNKNILIIADDVDGLALASLIQNNSTVTVMTPQGHQKTGTFNIACVRNPYNATRARDFLLDIACITGGTMISEQAGMKLDSTKIEQLGQAERVIVTKDTTTIIGGKASEALQERIKAVEKQIEETTSEYEKLMLEDRLACLTGGIGVIRVGAYTDTDFNEKKYKFDNAINSTQSALQEGIIAGGGSTFARMKVKEPMFMNALTAPLNQMAINAGMKGKKIVKEVKRDTFGSWGYDFKKKKFVNMYQSGIIDPVKVARIILESATHIATTLASIDTAIVDEQK